MNPFRLLSLIVFSSVVALSSWAGGRESGGGEVYGDALNPWFLENATDVSYCIEVDSANFGVSTNALATIVDSAIRQWKSAFANARANETLDQELMPYGSVRIATQNFRKENCGSSTAVRFQFGVLTNEQRRQFIPHPNEVIGETVRTSYDRRNLRGRGFIYLAPETGRLRPAGLKMAKHPWSFQEGLVLRRVLLHELGHLFGLSHSGNAYSLMGQAHPEYIVLESTIENLSKQAPAAIETALKRIGVFGFEFPFELESCPTDPIPVLGANEQDPFFGFSADTLCRRFVFSREGFAAYASRGSSGPYLKVGQATAPVFEDVFQPALRVRISGAQKVFSGLSRGALAKGYIDGPMITNRRVMKARYQSIDGLTAGEVKSTFLPSQQLQMDGILNGKFVELFK